jgi:hypothetical protein
MWRPRDRDAHETVDFLPAAVAFAFRITGESVGTARQRAAPPATFPEIR